MKFGPLRVSMTALVTSFAGLMGLNHYMEKMDLEQLKPGGLTKLCQRSDGVLLHGTGAGRHLDGQPKGCAGNLQQHRLHGKGAVLDRGHQSHV